MITILAVGKKHEDWIQPGLRRYEKRLQRPWDVKWELIPASSFDGDRARQDESERLLARLVGRDYVVLCDERGKLYDSPELSRLIERAFIDGRSVTLIIGGAYGVSDELRRRATVVWSLSPLVFPHQLMRLIVTEQLYRAQTIARDHPYHHN